MKGVLSRSALLAFCLALSACSHRTKPDDIDHSAATLGDFSGRYENATSTGFHHGTPGEPPRSKDLWESLLWAVDFERAREWRSVNGTVFLRLKDENTMVARLDSPEAKEEEIVLRGQFQDQGFLVDSASGARIFVIVNGVFSHRISFWLDGERRLVVTHDSSGACLLVVLPILGNDILLSRHAYKRLPE